MPADVLPKGQRIGALYWLLYTVYISVFLCVWGSGPEDCSVCRGPLPGEHTEEEAARLLNLRVMALHLVHSVLVRHILYTNINIYVYSHMHLPKSM